MNTLKVMIGISAIMFFVATFHLTIDFYLLLQGYSDTGSFIQALYLGDVTVWPHVLKYMLSGAQQTLGTATAIYHTWVLWSYDWKVVVFPIILLIMSIIIGVLTCSTKLSAAAFNSLTITYYSVAFALSVMTVGLMSYRIWIAHRNAANDCVGKPRLLSIMWILIESAALQIITEFIILVLFCIYDKPDIIVLEWVPPIVGITFNSITLRVKLQSLNEAGMYTQDEKDPVQTIGNRHPRVALDYIPDRPVEYYEDDGGEPSYDIAAPPQHSPTDRIHHLHNTRLLPSQYHNLDSSGFINTTINSLSWTNRPFTSSPDPVDSLRAMTDISWGKPSEFDERHNRSGDINTEIWLKREVVEHHGLNNSWFLHRPRLQGPIADEAPFYFFSRPPPLDSVSRATLRVRASCDTNAL
ncbi:hypothetical protein BDQ17DRAFT_1547861 [Cyathus striatus]|nr:hypothetical protein BDQ17DRAFT_1547861 [Cyathus striatus]